MGAAKILLTGPPGCGKTTVICTALERLKDISISGFYTAEQRDLFGRRVGFSLVPLPAGDARPFAHVGFISNQRVGRYGVDVEALNYVVDITLSRAAELYVVDEIGKMECFSRRFVEAMEKLLDGAHPLLATVAAKGGGLIAAAKKHPAVELWEVSGENRERLPAELAQRLKRGASAGLS